MKTFSTLLFFLCGISILHADDPIIHLIFLPHSVITEGQNLTVRCRVTDLDSDSLHLHLFLVCPLMSPNSYCFQECLPICGQGEEQGCPQNWECNVKLYNSGLTVNWTFLKPSLLLSGGHGFRCKIGGRHSSSYHKLTVRRRSSNGSLSHPPTTQKSIRDVSSTRTYPSSIMEYKSNLKCQNKCPLNEFTAYNSCKCISCKDVCSKELASYSDPLCYYGVQKNKCLDKPIFDMDSMPAILSILVIIGACLMAGLVVNYHKVYRKRDALAVPAVDQGGTEPSAPFLDEEEDSQV